MADRTEGHDRSGRLCWRYHWNHRLARSSGALAGVPPKRPTHGAPSQILSVYIHELLKSKKPYKLVNGVKQRHKAIEVGAGTGPFLPSLVSLPLTLPLAGLLSLSLHGMGYDVVSTDIKFVAQGILRANLSRNRSTALSAPTLEARTLDWFSPPSSWDWTSASITPSSRPTPPSSSTPTFLQPPFDLILTTDSVYDPSLSTPLLRTLHALSTPPLSPSPPPIYLSLEVRDPDLISSFLESARKEWGFKCVKVEWGRLERLVGREGDGGMGWKEEDWDGVEVWKLKWVGEKKERR